METQQQLITRLRTCTRCESTLTYLRNSKAIKKGKERVCRSCGNIQLIQDK